MKKIHYLTGLTITIFIGLHLFNHLMSIFGADAHLSFMQQIRPFYRNAIAETMLILAVLLQITTGIFLFAAKRNLKLNFYKKMQLYTGLYLAFFFVIHIGAVMSGRFLLNLDTNLYFGIAGLNTFPLNLFFMPYYSLAILAFFGHLAAIHSYKMKKNIFGLSVPQQSNLILTIGGAVTFGILYGLTNGFIGFEIPKEYHIHILIGK